MIAITFLTRCILKMKLLGRQDGKYIFDTKNVGMDELLETQAVAYTHYEKRPAHSYGRSSPTISQELLDRLRKEYDSLMARQAKRKNVRTTR